MKDRPHDEAMAEAYRKRPGEAFAMFRALLLNGGRPGLAAIASPMAKVKPSAGASTALRASRRPAGRRSAS